MTDSQTPVIDAVISWVDNTDQYIQTKYIDNNLKTFRYGKRLSLKYCLRSLYYNASWLRNIFIVTDNQWPSWLDEDLSSKLSPKIIRIDHKDIHPENKSMIGPLSIEMCLDRIPGLSDSFIYGNDDFFITKKIPIEYWFTNNYTKFYFFYQPIYERHKNIENNFKYYYTYWQVYQQYDLFKSLFQNDSIKLAHPNHQFKILNKKAFEIVKEKIPDLYYKTINSIGRPNELLISTYLLELICINEGLSKPVELKNTHGQMNIIDFEHQKKVNIKLNNILVCINNIYNVIDFDKDIPDLANILSNKIPSEII